MHNATIGLSSHPSIAPKGQFIPYIIYTQAISPCHIRESKVH
jgi:hypothetical protein